MKKYEMQVKNTFKANKEIVQEGYQVPQMDKDYDNHSTIN